MTYPLPSDDDGLIRLEPGDPCSNADRHGRRRRGRAGAGPVGRHPRACIRWIIESTDKPLVIDADGLNALAGQTELLCRLNRPVVVTPHPGEFARLTGTDVRRVQADRIGHAARLAATRISSSSSSRAPARS